MNYSRFGKLYYFESFSLNGVKYPLVMVYNKEEYYICLANKLMGSEGETRFIENEQLKEI